MATPKKSRKQFIAGARSTRVIEPASPLLLKTTRLRRDPKFTWVGEGNTQPPDSEGSFGLWFSPARLPVGRR